MNPVTLTLFVSQITASAPAPGPGVNTVTLSAVRGPNPVTAGPNDSLFDLPQNGNAQLNLMGVTDVVAKQFEKGKTYKLTIEDVPAQ